MKKNVLSFILVFALCLPLLVCAACNEDQGITVTVTETAVTADSVFNAAGYGSVYVEGSMDFESGEIISMPQTGLIGPDGRFLFDYKETWLRYYYDPESGIVTLSGPDYSTHYFEESMMISEELMYDAPRFYTLGGKTAFSVDCCAAFPMREGYTVVLRKDSREFSAPDGTEFYADFCLSLIDRSGQAVYDFPGFFGMDIGGMGDYYYVSYSFASKVARQGDGLIGFGTYRIGEHDDMMEILDNIVSGRFKVQGYMDMTGKTVFTLEGYSNMGPFQDGLAFVRDAETGLYGFIDRNGSEVIPCQYAEVGNFIDGYAYVRQDGLYGYIDKTGTLVIPCEYDAAFGAGSGLFSVGKDGKYGLVNAANEAVVPLEYDDISSSECGVAYAVKDHKVSVITISGFEGTR